MKAESGPLTFKRLSISSFPTSGIIVRSVAIILLFVSSCAIATAQNTDSSAVQDSLLLALQKEMAAFGDDYGSNNQSGTLSRSAPTTNPDISVIGDIRAGYKSEGDRNIDLGLEELELAL